MDNVLNKFSLKDKNIVITGATGILGKNFCEGLAACGGNLALIDVHQETLNEAVGILQKKYQVKVRGYSCDVADEDQVSRAVKAIESDFGHIDVLHNNAASKSSNLDEFFQDFEKYSYKIWKEVMSVNIDGMFLMAKHVGEHMVRKNIKGSIIQTASIYGVVAPDQRIYEGSFYMNRQISSPAVYSASKSAVIGLTNYLAAYWGAKGIRVNTLTPGGVESGQNTVFQNKYSARVPMNRMGQAEELIGALVYLASDASSYVTGQNLIVDGGLSVW